MFRYFAQNLVDPAPLPQPASDAAQLQNILTISFGIIGALAVLFVVIGGFRYITAAGDPAKVATARSQILYALVGLVVAGMAEVIVNFYLSL